jgi:hypothetical protein
MIRKTNQMTKLTAALAVLALAIPATSSAKVDLRNPDSKAAAAEAGHQQVDVRNADSRTPPVSDVAQGSSYVDVRNADSKDVGTPAQSYVDVRNADSKDVGKLAQSSPPAPQIVDASDFNWGDAAIGAGSVLALLLIGLSATFLVTHRRRQGVTA